MRATNTWKTAASVIRARCGAANGEGRGCCAIVYQSIARLGISTATLCLYVRASKTGQRCRQFPTSHNAHDLEQCQQFTHDFEQFDRRLTMLAMPFMHDAKIVACFIGIWLTGSLAQKPQESIRLLFIFSFHSASLYNLKYTASSVAVRSSRC